MGNVSTLMRLQEALEQAGIRFIEDTATGELGLVLKSKSKR